MATDPTQMPSPPAPPLAESGIRLAAIRVQDFRSLRDVTMRLQPGITVLVGENNSGKTSMLEALAVAMGSRRPRLEDLYQAPSGRVASCQLDIRMEPTSGEEFSDDVRGIVGDAMRVPAGADDPEYFVIRTECKLSADGLDVEVWRWFLDGWATTRVEAGAITKFLKPPVRREALGLLRFDMLDARRDIVEQLRNRRTHWGKATSGLDVTDGVRTELEGSLKELGDRVTSGSKVLGNVKEDLRELSQALSHGKLEVDIEALPTSLEDLVRAMDISVTAPESAKFSIASQGMGTRSLAAVLVFRSYVNAVRSRLDEGRTLSLSAFEEPEAHLHPQSQRAIFSLLAGIVGQKVISTHSSHVASVAEIEDYRLFRRSGSQVHVHAVPVGSFDTEAKIKARRFIQLQNPEVMFARAVGVVEGQTEAAAFPVFAEAWWPPRGADGRGVSLIFSGGAGSSKHIVPFLELLSIPWLIFCDGDAAALEGLRATSKAIGRQLDGRSLEVVQLPEGKAWERALIDEGFSQAAEASAKLLKHTSLDAYATLMHGQGQKGTDARRDYSGPDRLKLAAVDFLCGEKGTIGAIFAAEVLKVGASPGNPTYPKPVREFFTKLDALLEGKKP